MLCGGGRGQASVSLGMMDLSSVSGSLLSFEFYISHGMDTDQVGEFPL